MTLPVLELNKQFFDVNVSDCIAYTFLTHIAETQ